jgi:cation diffusion facilitator family transporter
MHSHRLDEFTHAHDYAGDNAGGESRTRRVIWLTAAMMVVEIAAGTAFGSMALLADGWHMATHVAAFGIALFAYRYARTQASNPRYSYGTGKVGVLGGFASAVALGVVALMMALESALRLVEPQAVRFDEALVVAVLGLLVNLASGWMLRDKHTHDHDHGPAHAHDHNLRAAYLHVLADALTSVFAIAALVAGKYTGWVWLDPAMGLLGAAVIARWSWSLVIETGPILLDGAVDASTSDAVRAAIEGDADNKVADLHLWHVGPAHYAVTVALVTHQPREPAHYKALLAGIPGLSHVIIEVNLCREEAGALL